MKNKTVEVIGMIYKSVDFLNFMCNQLNNGYSEAEGWDVHFRIIANDATPEVIEALKEQDIPYTVYTDPYPEDFYLNRVYRAWNLGGYSSEFDHVCFINSDMAFSKGWLSNLLRNYDGTSIPCSRLVESGKLRSGQYGVEMDFGTNPSSYNELGFEDFADQISEKEVVHPGGLFMPCVFSTEAFIELGGYPEGNIFMKEGKYEVGRPNDIPPYMSGDEYFFATAMHTLSIKHETVFDSIVYHMQEGEKDE